MKLAPGLVIADKYRLERRLAAGGMGSIWVARHAQLDVPVAIKFMDSSHAASAVSRQRFEREAKAAASLRSANVVHVQDYGVSDDVPYIVMELLQGEDLGRRLHRERRLPLAQASKILSQTARGLRRAHESGIVHRDLKPANIFLTRADSGDDEEMVKLLDFGIAKETLSPLVGEATKAGELMGSPHYMSPEQIRGAADLDPRSDLWSLGVVIFRAITGQMPFSGDVLGSIIAQILADPIPLATKAAPDLPPAVDAFFTRAFARDRNLRFQSAREMADEFASIVQGAPVASEPIGLAPVSILRAVSQADSEQPPTGSGVLTPPGRFTPSGTTSPDTPAPASEPQASVPSTTMGSTGGPLIATGGPLPGASPSARWSSTMVGAAAALIVVGGGIAYFSLRSAPTHDAAASSPAAHVDEAPSQGPEPSAAPSATDAVPPSATTASQAAPGPSAAGSPGGEPGAGPKVAPSAAATAATRPSASPSAAPKATSSTKGPSAPPPASSVKKRPSWGF